MSAIDLNCDVGEGIGNEAEILPWVSSANVACGAHAGDERTMAETMETARRLGVVVGAHPGFADREGFGRREQELGSAEIFDLVSRQLASLASHGQFRYVKPHGALYTMAARDGRVAAAIAEAVRSFDPALVLLGLAGGRLLEAGRRAGLPVVGEGFVDRRYDDDGHLVSRGRAGAVIEDESEAVAQGVSLAVGGRVEGVGGRPVEVEVGSICIHGDSTGAVGFAESLRAALASAGCRVRPFVEVG